MPLRSAGRRPPVAYGEAIRLGEVDVSFVPAGHVLGSAQIVLEHRGERIVVSGDYKRRPDPTCAPFEPVPCDIFITEATFGLPVFRHPATAEEVDRLLQRLHDNPDRCILVGAYALGKAQRLIAELRCRGHHDPIYIHGALQRLCELYAQLRRGARRPSPRHRRGQGRARGPDRAGPARLPQRPLVAPPARSDHRDGLGLDAVRQRARQRMVELPLIVSDHADWDELTGTIAELRADAKCGSPTAARKRSSIGA